MKISMAQILFPIIVILFFILLMGCGSYTPPKVASHNNPKSIPTVPDIVTRPSSDVLMKNKK